MTTDEDTKGAAHELFTEMNWSARPSAGNNRDGRPAGRSGQGWGEKRKWFSRVPKETSLFKGLGLHHCVALSFMQSVVRARVRLFAGRPALANPVRIWDCDRVGQLLGLIAIAAWTI